MQPSGNSAPVRRLEDVVWNDIGNKSVEVPVTELGEHLLLVLLARAEMALQEWRGQSGRRCSAAIVKKGHQQPVSAGIHLRTIFS